MFERQGKGEEYNRERVVSNIKLKRGSIRALGCMAAKGIGEMTFCEGIMNSQKYISVLEKILRVSFCELFR